MPQPKQRLSKREIHKRIYMSGTFSDYQVHHNIEGSAIVCYVAQAKIGFAIVRALRSLAYAEHGHT